MRIAESDSLRKCADGRMTGSQKLSVRPQISTDKRAYRHQLPNCRQLEVETLIPTQAIPFGIPRQGNDALEHQCSGAPSLALFKQALSRDPFVIR